MSKKNDLLVTSGFMSNPVVLDKLKEKFPHCFEAPETKEDAELMAQFEEYFDMMDNDPEYKALKDEFFTTIIVLGQDFDMSLYRAQIESIQKRLFPKPSECAFNVDKLKKRIEELKKPDQK